MPDGVGQTGPALIIELGDGNARGFGHVQTPKMTMLHPKKIAGNSSLRVQLFSQCADSRSKRCSSRSPIRSNTRRTVHREHPNWRAISVDE